MKVKYINSCTTFFDYKQMVLLMICQEMWALGGLRNMISERGVIGSQRPGNFLLVSVSLILQKRL